MKKFFLVALMGIMAVGIDAAKVTGTYTTRETSDDGKTSSWAMDVVSGSAVKIKVEVTDNEMIFSPSSSEKIQFATSKYASIKSQSSIYIPVPAGSAGTVSHSPSSASDSRWFQLYINGTAGTVNQRLWSKEGTDLDKKGPRSFAFTASDITTYGGKTYLHFKDNNTEMKIASFTITLTTGSYSGGDTPPAQSDDATLKDLKVNGVTVPGFSSSTTAYEVEVEGETVPTVTATTNHSGASYNVIPALGVPGTTQVIVSAQKGNTLTYTVTFKKAPNRPRITSFVIAGVTGVITHADGGNTITATVPYNVDLTSLTPVVSVNAYTNGYTPQGAQNFTSPVTYTAIAAETGAANTVYTVTIAQSPKPQPGDLTAHEPDIYEAPKMDGGYETPLTAYNGREYEVYYTTRYKKDGSNNVAVVCTAEPGTIVSTDETETGVKGEWLKASMSSLSGGTTERSQAEFTKTAGIWKFTDNKEMTIQVKGFDQFSMLAKDNNADASKERMFVVYIDGVKQNRAPVASHTVRRYDISSDEHTIRIVGIGSSNNELYGFSLRVGNEPRVRWFDGNDTTQEVLQTRSLSPITYYVKNNVQTKVIWDDGKEYTDITLQSVGKDAIGDTLELTGQVMRPVGTYGYRIVAYDANGMEKSSVRGTFTVTSRLDALTDTIATGYTNWPMSTLQFRFYALSAEDITLTWPQGAPAGITSSASGNIYSIAGTPTAAGVYPYSISVKGGNSFTGRIVISDIDLGDDPLLYVYKSASASERDGVYQYLSHTGYNLIGFSQEDMKVMTDEQLGLFKMLIISEDVDANHEQILRLIRERRLPILNMKAFTYTASRLGWGYPDNGSLSNTKIRVQQASHPIFKAMQVNQGDELTLIDQVTTRGLMPVEVTEQGSWCLAIAPTRGKDYTGDGALQTFLHEMPIVNGHKYILLPIATPSSSALTEQGRSLISQTVGYLLYGTSQPLDLPKLRITSFVIDGVQGRINEDEKTIAVTMPIGTDPSSLTPVVSLADATTFVSPASGETIDMSDWYTGVTYTVSDYINIVRYQVFVNVVTGLEEVTYTPGEWVDIYDIRGTKVATTNANVYTLALPRGLYLIRTATETFKLMR